MTKNSVQLKRFETRGGRRGCAALNSMPRGFHSHAPRHTSSFVGGDLRFGSSSRSRATTERATLSDLFLRGSDQTVVHGADAHDGISSPRNPGVGEDHRVREVLSHREDLDVTLPQLGGRKGVDPRSVGSVRTSGHPSSLPSDLSDSRSGSASPRLNACRTHMHAHSLGVLIFR